MSIGGTMHPEPPPLRNRPGPIVIQNMPNVPIYSDPDLPPGTIEFWQDGKLVGRITNIGSK